jgi:hypothetical protein
MILRRLIFTATVCVIALMGLTAIVSAQTFIDTVYAVPNDGGNDSVWVQIPANYDPQHPPAILVWWHGLGAHPWELRDYSGFAAGANERGWIAASSFGPHDRHWDTRRAQLYVNYMLTWLMAEHPFALDSIYMAGSSMGAAAGQVFHNNNCGTHDFLIAATVGGSQIIDTERRAIEYLETEPTDTNRSMRAAFGGLPCHPDSCQSFDSTAVADEFAYQNLPCAATRCDSIGFEYHRYSAVYLADTTKSMHFNGAYLPVYSTWGADDAERERYGVAAWMLFDLRAGFPAPSHFFEAGSAGHGYLIMDPTGAMDWLAQFSVNRYPDALSLAADQDADYYWTHVSLSRPYVFGRWGAVRDLGVRRIELELARNIDTIDVDLDRFQLGAGEHLAGRWTQRDPLIQRTVVAFHALDGVSAVNAPNGPPAYQFDAATSTLFITLGADSDYSLTVDGDGARERNARSLPETPRLSEAFPNPFNSIVTLSIESPITFFTDLDVYSILGQRAKSVPVQVRAGRSEVRIDTEGLASGSYFVTLRSQPVATIKIVLLK